MPIVPTEDRREPASAMVVHFGSAGHLADLRRMVTTFATDNGFDPERAHDAALAASELATNSLEHGGGIGRMAFWADHGDLVCEISDHGWPVGHGSSATPPDPTKRSGRGLWLVAQVGDIVERRPRNDGMATRVVIRQRRPTTAG